MQRLPVIITLFLLIAACGISEISKAPLPVEEPILIAHRGASAYTPEHTILAYEAAKQAGATYIEIDLQMTKDGVLVAMHDEKVDRTTDGNGFVKEYTLEELKQLNAGQSFNRQMKHQTQ